MAMDFAVMCQLVRRSRLIRFLFVGSRVCSTLPSDDTSRCRPCASLFLHLHQVGKGTSTLKLRNMLGTQKKLPPRGSGRESAICHGERNGPLSLERTVADRHLAVTHALG